VHICYLFVVSVSGAASHRSPRSNADMDAAVPASSGEEELQLQLALAMSKEEHEEEVKRHKADELKLQLAIEESKKTARIGSTYSKVLSLFRTSAVYCVAVQSILFIFSPIHYLIRP